MKMMQAVQDCHNILITGGAGVGKTYHTNKIIEHLKSINRKFAVCAMTGLASQHLHFGMTIHRFLQTGAYTRKDDILALEDKLSFEENLSSISHVTTIIIDEVSMMRTDYLELVDIILKRARSYHNMNLGMRIDYMCDLPFGGYQLILVGDFCQLPPVVKKDEKVPCKWVFQHQIFKDAKFRVYNLIETKRTSDPLFANTLNKIRVGYCDADSYTMIKEREAAVLNKEGTVLMSRVENVRMYNESRLGREDGAKIELEGIVSIRKEAASEKEVKALYREVINNSGLDKTITLKVGCKVIILSNNPEMNYSNGSQGVLLGTKFFDEHNNSFMDNQNFTYQLDYKYFGECLHILLDSGVDVIVPKKQFSLYGSDFDINGKRLIDALFFQYPVALGYGLSIHKAQGMSLSSMVLDCAKIFSPGQFYVGLSRATSLQGLSIFNFHKSYVMADEDAVNFYVKISQFQPGEIYE